MTSENESNLDSENNKEKNKKKMNLSAVLKGRNAHTDKVGAGAAPKFKVRFSIKLSVFVLATLALSWFFEGFRQVNEAPTAWGLALLFGGTTLTIILVGVYGFFIYAEERAKGSPIRNIPLFDRWYRHFTEKGDK